MRILVLLAVLAAGGGGVVAGNATKPGGAALRIVQEAPLVLRGSGFRPRERVSVTVRMGATVLVRRTRAGAAGGFTVRWPSARLRACSLPLVIRAKGTATGVVDADLGHRDCAPQ